MASRKRKGGATKNDLLTAIRYMGGQASLHLTKKQLKDIWGKIRKEHREQGIELPRIQTIIKQAKQEQEFEYEDTVRDSEMNTEPPENTITLGTEYIDKFIDNVTAIYQETKNYISSAPLNDKGNIKDPEFYFLANNEDLMDAQYREILSIVNSMRSQFSDDVVAQALSSDVELDYTMALVFIPDSDVQNNFEITIEQLTGIMINLSSTFIV